LVPTTLQMRIQVPQGDGRQVECFTGPRTDISVLGLTPLDLMSVLGPMQHPLHVEGFPVKRPVEYDRDDEANWASHYSHSVFHFFPQGPIIPTTAHQQNKPVEVDETIWSSHNSHHQI